MDLSALLSGLQGAVGRRGHMGTAPRLDPFDGLQGNDLQQAGVDALNARMPGEIEQRRQIQSAAGDPHADFNAANDAIMGSSTRSPGWSGFFGVMGGKRLGGNVGGTQSVGRMREAPGSDGTLEQTGVDWPVESQPGQALMGLQRVLGRRGR